MCYMGKSASSLGEKGGREEEGKGRAGRKRIPSVPEEFRLDLTALLPGSCPIVLIPTCLSADFQRLSRDPLHQGGI